MTIAIRLATPSDAAAVNKIYNPLIEGSSATFETEPYSTAARAEMIAGLADDPRYPFLAAEIANEFAGYAYAAPFDPREGYRTSVKTSVFVAPSAHRMGVGRALYADLIPRLAAAGLHRAYALIVAPNPGSESLHQAFGFRHVATLNEVGWKLGRFHDVVWYELRLRNSQD